MLDQIKLTNIDLQKWYRNLLVFLAPVVIIYLTQVIGLIQQANGALILSNFLPTPFTLGAIVLYVANAMIDYLKKLNAL